MMSKEQQLIKLVIEGMTCSGCAKTVSALIQKAGFDVDEINHETGIAIVKGNSEQIDLAKNLIEAAGYKIKKLYLQD